MTDRTHKTIEQAEQEGKYIRKVRSFVKREGRLTNAQARALEEHWPTLGLNHCDGMIDASALFDNNNPVVLEIGFGMGKSLVEMAKNAPELNFIGVEVEILIGRGLQGAVIIVLDLTFEVAKKVLCGGLDDSIIYKSGGNFKFLGVGVVVRPTDADEPKVFFGIEVYIGGEVGEVGVHIREGITGVIPAL